MSSKLYVGNLAYDATDAGVEELFAAHGTVTSPAAGAALRRRRPGARVTANGRPWAHRRTRRNPRQMAAILM